MYYRIQKNDNIALLWLNEGFSEESVNNPDNFEEYTYHAGQVEYKIGTPHVHLSISDKFAVRADLIALRDHLDEIIDLMPITEEQAKKELAALSTNDLATITTVSMMMILEKGDESKTHGILNNRWIELVEEEIKSRPNKRFEQMRNILRSISIDKLEGLYQAGLGKSNTPGSDIMMRLIREEKQRREQENK